MQAHGRDSESFASETNHVLLCTPPLVSDPRV